MCQAAIDKLYVLGRRVQRLDERQAGVCLNPVMREVEPGRPLTKFNHTPEQAAVDILHTVSSYV